MNSFDYITDKYFPGICSKWYILFLATFLTVINQPFFFLGQFAFLTPEHHCRQPQMIASGWSKIDVLNLSVPIETYTNIRRENEQFSSCTEYDIDLVWSEMTVNTTLDDAFEIRQKLYPNKTKRHCTRGIEFELDSAFLRYSASQDFEIVCDNAYYISVANSLYNVGMQIGFLLAGPLADNFGRRTVVIWTSCIGYLFGLLTGISTTFSMFLCLRILVAIFMNITFVAGCILMSELVSKDGRNTVSVIRKIHSAILPYGSLLLIFYFTQNWRWTHMIFCYPMIALVAGFFIWTESPRWLLSQGKMRACKDTTLTILSQNGIVLDDEKLQVLIAELNELAEMNESQEVRWKRRGPKTKLSIRIYNGFLTECKRIYYLMKHPILRKRFLVVSSIFIFEAFVYFGISFYAIRLDGNPYIIALVTRLIGIPSNILQFVVYKYFDRKRPMIAFYAIATVTLAIAFFLFLFGYQGTPVIAVTTVGLLFINALFTMLYTRLPELFPSTHRATALGLAGFLGPFGVTISMFVERLDEMVWKPLPLLIFTIVSLFAIFVSLCMPEGSGEMNDVVIDAHHRYHMNEHNDHDDTI